MRGDVSGIRIRPVAMRHTYRQERECLFELCGYSILAAYDDYRYHAARDTLIWVVTKSPSHEGRMSGRGTFPARIRRSPPIPSVRHPSVHPGRCRRFDIRANIGYPCSRTLEDDTDG